MDQKKILRYFTQLTLCLIFCIILTGCPEEDFDAFVETSIDLGKFKASVIQNVIRFKRNYKSKELTAEYHKAETLYSNAYTKISSWVDFVSLVKNSHNGKNYFEADAYKNHSIETQKAVTKFNKYIDETLNPKSSGTGSINKIVSEKIVIDIIVGIGTVGINWWIAYQKLNKADREAELKTFEEKYKWPYWHEIKC